MTAERLSGKSGMWCGASSEFDYMVEGRWIDRQALAKKSSTRSNSFFQFFIFWGFRLDFDFSEFFSGGSIPHCFFTLQVSLQDSKQ